MHRWTLMIPAFLWLASSLSAEVVSKSIEYRHDNRVLEGFLVYDDAVPAKRPGVLLVHEDGPGSAQGKQRAGQWARAGYVVFSADLYGMGVQPKDRKDAQSKAGLSDKDRKTVRGRTNAGLETLKKQNAVLPEKLVAVGYGVGGNAVLELARDGAGLEGAVCVHGDLSTPTPDAKKIKARLLILLGTDDPLIPNEQLTAFEDELRKGGADWQVTRFGGAVHGFTNPASGKDLSKGVAYDSVADKRAGEAIRQFLLEIFPAGKAPAKTGITLPKGVPQKVADVLAYVDENEEAPKGYEGGRNFGNFEKLLPRTDDKNKPIKYQEWDVNPLKPGVNRGAERLVTGSDGSAYYTEDHYKSFIKIR